MLFFGLFFCLLALVIGGTWYRYVVVMDYYVLLQAPCNPGEESCYLSVCNPAEAECSETSPEDIYYKTIKKKAYSAEACFNRPGGCVDVLCAPGEKHCSEIQCDTSQEESGGVCYSPDFTPLEDMDSTEDNL